jgi:type II secretory pathway component PulC
MRRNFLQKLRESDLFKPGRGSSLASPLLRALGSGFLYMLLGGLLAAFIFCSVVSGLLASRIMDVQRALADIVTLRGASSFVSGHDSGSAGMEIKFAAFGVPDSNPASADKRPDVSKPISSFQLVGTLPAVAAWISAENATKLVLKSQDFNGYVLDTVERGMVLFSRDGETFPLYLTLSAGGPPPPGQPQPQVPQTPPPGGAQVTQAVLNGEDGMLAKELINSVIENPQEELSKVRLVPVEGGMLVRNVRADSLLAQAGIKQGDIITGVNGLPITNMPDLINVMRSLMTFTRFDLSLNRDQNPGKLGYVVR